MNSKGRSHKGVKQLLKRDNLPESNKDNERIMIVLYGTTPNDVSHFLACPFQENPSPQFMGSIESISEKANT